MARIDVVSGPLSDEAAPADTATFALANGVRVVTIRLPDVPTCRVSVFVRTGSQHESRRLAGISHVVEHMAFKGTAERDCQRINLDAESLGAEVNAHTDKDHTAFHMDGLAADATAFVQMLGDIVQNSVFPPAELERERQVILHELTDDDEDLLSAAFKLFDKACFGDHAIARPVIGTRPTIQRLTRDDLLGYVRSQYTAGNVVVAAAGDIDPQQIVRAAEAAFGNMPAGGDNRCEGPTYAGGFRLQRDAGGGQTHVVIGYPCPSLHGCWEPSVVAAAVLGEGMSSPLLDEIRERRGLAYHVACSADVGELCGQFFIEASTAPQHAVDLIDATHRLLKQHAASVDPGALQRARNQLTVRHLRAQQRPSRRLEAAALDLFVLGRVRSAAEWTDRMQSVGCDDVSRALTDLLAHKPAVALTGKVTKAATDRATALVGA